MSKKSIDNENNLKTYPSILAAERRQNAIRVGFENKLILQRIQNTDPVYDRHKWELEAKKRGEYLHNMTTFPDYFVNPYEKKKGARKKAAAGGTGTGFDMGASGGSDSAQNFQAQIQMQQQQQYDYEHGQGGHYSSGEFAMKASQPMPPEEASRLPHRPVSDVNTSNY